MSVFRYTKATKGCNSNQCLYCSDQCWAKVTGFSNCTDLSVLVLNLEVQGIGLKY